MIRVTLAGEPWKINRPKTIKGEYANCLFDKRTINIEQEHEGYHLLVYAIHEMLHVQFPTAGEDHVRRAAEEMAEVVRLLRLLRSEDCACE